MSAPTPAPGDDRPREGYYPDPSIPGYVRYWNGASWVPGTSRPAPQDGESLAPPPGAGAAPAASVEETGPHFFDEDPVDEPAPADAQHGSRPEPASAWGADRSRQSGFGGDQDRRVSWGAPQGAQEAQGAARQGADPRLAHADRGPAGESPRTDGTAPVPPAGQEGNAAASGSTFVFRRPSGKPGGGAPEAPDEGTMTFRAVTPRSGGSPGAAQPGQGAAGRPPQGGATGRGTGTGANAGAPGFGSGAGSGVAGAGAGPAGVAGVGAGSRAAEGSAHAPGAAGSSGAPGTPGAPGGPAVSPGPGPGSGSGSGSGSGRSPAGAGFGGAAAVPGSGAAGPGFGGPAGPVGSGSGSGSGAAFGRPSRPAGAAGPAQAPAGPAFSAQGGPAPADGADRPGFGAGKAAAARAAAAQAPAGPLGAQASAAGSTALSGPQAAPTVPPQPGGSSSGPAASSAPLSPGPGGGQSSWAQQVHRLAGGGDEQPVAPWKPPVEDVFQAAARRQASARPAGLGKRLAARLVDTVVLLGLTATAAVPLGSKTVDHVDAKIEAARLSGETVTVWLLDGTTSVYLGVILAVLLLAGVLTEVLPTAKWGRTLGKRLTGLDVRDIEGHDTPGFGAALRRWLVYSVPGLLVVGVVGVAWCLFDKPWRQCWHDKAAHTFVAG
ncbi:RDD family protein [Streptomyces sp. NPDC093516]|uniref:RDD family protein n=1 Tax=Streptomyces sp. NPDC093516 TaxID=3155304 RepID=UPI0034372EF0